MKISVIIPVYNGERYISECLLSLLNQTYKNWEAILINDGSTDNSLVLLSSFAEKDNRFIIYNQINSGAAAARAMGIREMKGNYVTFLDVDDTLAINYMETLVSQFDTEVDIVATTFKIIKKRNTIKKKYLCKGLYTGVNYLKRVLSGKFGWELCAKMYRQELFDDSIKVPERIRIGEDAAIYVQLIMRARKVRIIDEPLYNYIQHSSSASHVRSKEYAEETLRAAFYIDSLLKKEIFYHDILKEVAAMFLLFYSNSTRKAVLGLNHPLVREIYEKYYSLETVKLLPCLKGMYVTFSFLLEKIFRKNIFA